MDRIRVGGFELYPDDRRLCASGQTVELGARAFDLLVVLVENAGRLVTKATLLDRVWPRLVVDENNLPAQIASLRRVLGAGAIRTVPKYGYRLDLPVVPEDVAGQPDGNRTAPQPPAPGQAANGLGPLVGRDADLQAVVEIVHRACLLTIVGGAGVGKTRLAQEVHAKEAERGGRSVVWVSLEPLADSAQAASAIGLALGLSLPGDGDRFEALARALDKSPVLLVLDGAEHLAAQLAGPLAALLWKTPSISALVTSQVPLGIVGETVYRLPSLSVPDANEQQDRAQQHGAVELFALRAAQADRHFRLGPANTGLVTEICRRLDGNPLALGLAAARVPGLGLAALRERLDDRFRLLKQPVRAGEPRHGVLQAAFDWSYALLTAPEQRVFNRLGPFAGSFTIDTGARTVADEDIDRCDAIDLIGRLVDRSMVTVLPGDPPRYALLETARVYALDRLCAADELHSARARMAGAMLELLDRAYEEYWSQDEAVWLNQYVPDIDNARAALAWARTHDASLAVSLYGTAWPLFVETNLHAECRAAEAEVVGLLNDSQPRARVGRFWEAVATIDSMRQCDRARYAAELAADLQTDAGARYFSLLQLALNCQDDDTAAQTALDQARGLEDPAWPARLLAHGAITEGALLTARGEFVGARAAYLRALHHALTISERQALAATVSIVELDVACGATEAALQLGRPLVISLRHSGRRETRFELLVTVFSALLLAGATEEARSVGAEIYDLAVRLDSSRLHAVLDGMALFACADGRHETAARVAACADAAHAIHGQLRRGPANERVRKTVVQMLDARFGAGWRAAAASDRSILDERTACARALGLA